MDNQISDTVFPWQPEIEAWDPKSKADKAYLWRGYRVIAVVLAACALTKIVYHLGSGAFKYYNTKPSERSKVICWTRFSAIRDLHEFAGYLYLITPFCNSHGLKLVVDVLKYKDAYNKHLENRADVPPKEEEEEIDTVVENDKDDGELNNSKNTEPVVHENNGRLSSTFLAQKNLIFMGQIKPNSFISIAPIEILTNEKMNGILCQEPRLSKSIFLEEEELVQALLIKGANLNQKTSKGYTPLAVAISTNNKNIVSMLLKKGADPKESGIKDCSILMLAATMASKEILEEILKYDKGDVNEVNQKGETALMAAAIACHDEGKDLEEMKEKIKFLLTCGANVNLKNIQGQTALDCYKQGLEDNAITEGDSDIMRLLQLQK